MEKRTFFIWRDEKNDYEEVEFEIQPMDIFIYQRINSNFLRSLDLKTFAENLFKEMIASPAEARNLDFWGDDLDGIDEFSGILSEYQEGFYKPKKEKSKEQKAKEKSYQKKEA